MPNAPWGEYQPIVDPEKEPCPQPGAGAWMITGRYANDYGMSVILLVFMLAWGGFPFFGMLLPKVRAMVSTGRFDLTGLLFTGGIPLLFTVIASVVIVKALRDLVATWKERRLGVPQLSLPAAAVHPGETVRCDFERQTRAGRSLPQNGTLTARLLCVEVTKHEVGTTVNYDHVILWEQPAAPAPVFAGTGTLRAHWTFTLPSNLPPQQINPSNWVVWEVQVLQQLPGVTSTTSRFMLPVLPAGPALPGEGDATKPATTLRDWLNQTV